MYTILLTLHSGLRWLVLSALLYAIFTAVKGMISAEPFGRKANSIRSLTMTFAHLQLLIGMLMYIKSPYVGNQSFEIPNSWPNPNFFFRYIHVILMLLSVILVTIGSSKIKRINKDRQKYKLLLNWYLAAFIVICLAIPWPFSPLAARPYFQGF